MRNPEKVNNRTKYRNRRWGYGTGSIDLGIPNPREGSHRQHSERTLVKMISESFVNCVPT